MTVRNKQHVLISGHEVRCVTSENLPNRLASRLTRGHASQGLTAAERQSGRRRQQWHQEMRLVCVQHVCCSQFSVAKSLPVTPRLDPNGPTFLAYTPNGRRLITAGSNDTIRIFETDSDSEPVNIHDCPDGSTAVVATVCTVNRTGEVCTKNKTDESMIERLFHRWRRGWNCVAVLFAIQRVRSSCGTMLTTSPGSCPEC